MRMHLLLTFLLILPVFACGGADDEPPARTPLQKPVAPMGNALEIKKVADKTMVKNDLTMMRRQIDLAAKIGDDPPPVSELKRTGTAYKIGVEYDYDPATGKVTSRTFPNL